MLLLAAGLGRRFGSPTPKVYLECAGTTLVERSLARLAAVTDDREIIVACPPEADWEGEGSPAAFTARLEAAGATRIVTGGASRQESMQRCLDASDPEAGVVLVHDAARPFFPVEAVRKAIAHAEAGDSALLAIPAPDTLKRVDPEGRVEATVDRAGVWLAQTPQVMPRASLLRALDEARRTGFDGTDDVSLLERLGETVHVVTGSPTNIKITSPQDMGLAEQIAAAEKTT